MADNKLIKQININGTLYDIYDESALHSVAELGLDGVMYFRGTKGTIAELPFAGANGDVWHVTENNMEYVWTGSKWEEFGSHIVVDHTHDVSASGFNKLEGTATLGEFRVTGTATITGAKNSASNVTGTGSGKATVTLPTVDKQAKYAKVNTGTIEVLQTVGLSKSNLDTTTVSAVGTTSVISSVTPSTGSVTGVSGSVTASKASAGSAVDVATVDTAKTVATGLTGGSAAAWSADVTDGVLSFIFTPNTLQTAETTSITPAKANGSIISYTFSDVTVPKAATAATTVVTGVSTDSATVATKGSDITVATGSISATGKGSSVGIDMASPQKATVLNSATLAAGSAAVDLYVGDVVTVGSEAEEIDLSVDVTGTAAAQNWSYTSVSLNEDCKTTPISGAISVSGDVSVTGTTGAAKA
jgi:hypothetical protein